MISPAVHARGEADEGLKFLGSGAACFAKSAWRAARALSEPRAAIVAFEPSSRMRQRRSPREDGGGA
jgi:hypothetical protein